MLRRLLVLVVCLMAAITTASAQTPPYNEIWYTTTDGRPLFINRGYKGSVGLYMYSDTYNNGRGVLKFESGGYINFIKSGLFNGNDRLKSITIPNSVTSIGNKAFIDCSSLTSITIPNSVTSIGEWAFSGCSSLTSITIPNSVTSIGEWAFSGCSSLTSITIPDSVKSIGDYAFIGCSSLTSITIPNSVTSIGEHAFEDCSSLTSITIPDSVTEIGWDAFAHCSSLTSITIPNSVTEIGWDAFSGCSSLTSITIPDSVTSIGDHAFLVCSSLTSITIPNSVTSIGEHAFAYCSSLTSITIGNSVTEIEGGAFSGCSSLGSVKISNKYCYDYFKKLGVPDITFIVSTPKEYEEAQKLGATKLAIDSNSKYASEDGLCLIDNGKLILFIGKDLTEYTIPESVTSIRKGAFNGCSNLKSFKGKFASEDGRCLIKDGELIAFAPAGLTSYTIPNSVTSIGEHAFSGCSSLTSITIPESVKSIGEEAFRGCSSLKSVKVANKYCYDYFKDKVTNIAFYGANASDDGRCLIIDGELKIFIAKGITEYTIPESVKSIGRYAFCYCSLKSITIPNSVTSIDSYAFEDYSSLKSVKVSNKYCYDYFKSEVDDIAFYGANASDDGRCLIIDGELKIFIAKGITEYTIPESVTSIEDHTFNGCSSLTSITIGNSVTSIGYGAFRGCSNLTSITIPESVKSIGEEAFRGCSNLKSVKVANKYCYDYFKDEVDDIAFYGANVSDDGRCLIVNGELQRFIGKGITEYTIPESVTSIGEKAFYRCYSLTSITCLATTPPAIDDLMIAETTMIYVPKEAVKAYKKDPEWSIYKKQIKAIK